MTFSTVKWPHLARQAPVHIVRCSIGRSGEVAVLQRDDEELAALAVAELGDALGITAQPVARRVTRWGGGLPQYNVGHLDRVARVRAAVAEQPAWPSPAPRSTASASLPAPPPRSPPPPR